MAACHLGGGGRGAHGGEAAPPLPFTLIQGPPGTGKTHTVKVTRMGKDGVEEGARGLRAWQVPGCARLGRGAAPASSLGPEIVVRRAPRLCSRARNLPGLSSAVAPLARLLQGVLNVWHLVAYQAYFDGLVAAALPGPAPAAPRPAQGSSLNDAGSNIVEVCDDGGDRRVAEGGWV